MIHESWTKKVVDVFISNLQKKKELTYGLEGDLDDGMLSDRYHICTAFHQCAFVHESSNCTIWWSFESKIWNKSLKCGQQI